MEGDQHLGYVCFPSVKEAAEHVGCSSSAISQSVSKGKGVAGIVWRHKAGSDCDDKENEEEVSREAMDALKGCCKPSGVSVRATGVTGQQHVFSTLRGATDFLGVSYSGAAPRIQLAASSGQGYHGYKWALIQQ